MRTCLLQKIYHWFDVELVVSGLKQIARKPKRVITLAEERGAVLECILMKGIYIFVAINATVSDKVI